MSNINQTISPSPQLNLAYVPLSENGGVLVHTETDKAISLIHNHDGTLAYNLCDKGDRPTIINKEFAISLLSDPALKLSDLSCLKSKEGISPKYRYLAEKESTLTPEYQLYLANELEREANRRNSKLTKDVRNVLPELTGLLPHEEEQDEH
jgi:hypothetical protein